MQKHMRIYIIRLCRFIPTVFGHASTAVVDRALYNIYHNIIITCTKEHINNIMYLVMELAKESGFWHARQVESSRKPS